MVLQGASPTRCSTFEPGIPMSLSEAGLNLRRRHERTALVEPELMAETVKPQYPPRR